MVFFSVLSFFALAFTVLFLVIWIIKAILKKKTKMWLAAIVSLVVAISSFIAFGAIHDSKQTDQSSHSEQVSATSFTAQPEEESTTTAPPTTTTTKATTTTKPKKTLSNYRFKSADLIGDAGNVIGSRGYVNMEWEVFDEASDKEIHEFLERAYFNRYDYVNIFFDNGAVLWSWGDEDMFQIGDMPNQGYGAVKLDENNSDGIQGQYTWIGSYYSHS